VSVEINVSEVGKDAVEAREKAMATGERMAFEKLAQERNPASAAKIAAQLSPAQISAMVKGYEVVEEKMSPTTYKAALRYDFDDRQVDSVLGSAAATPAPSATNAPMAEAPTGEVSATPTAQPFAPPAATTQPASQPVAASPATGVTLVLPVMKKQTGLVLWEGGNDWREALNQMALQQGRGQVVMAYGDPTDMQAINAGNASTASYAMLEPLAKRYGANSVIVAIADPVEASSPPIVELVLREVAPSLNRIDRLRVEGKTEGDEKTVLAEAASALVTGIAARAEKNQYAQDEQTINTIMARLELSNARDWSDLRQRLASIGSIHDVKVTLADWERVEMQLTYEGDEAFLQRMLAGVNVEARPGSDMLLLALR
jgi:hypothetical protein